MVGTFTKPHWNWNISSAFKSHLLMTAFSVDVDVDSATKLKFWPLIQRCPWLRVYWKEVVQFISWTSSGREKFWISIALPGTTYGKKRKDDDQWPSRKERSQGTAKEWLRGWESSSVSYSQCFQKTSSRLKLLRDKEQVGRQDHQDFVLVDFIHPGTAILQCKVNYISPPPSKQVGRNTESISSSPKS